MHAVGTQDKGGVGEASKGRECEDRAEGAWLLMELQFWLPHCLVLCLGTRYFTVPHPVRQRYEDSSPCRPIGEDDGISKWR